MTGEKQWHGAAETGEWVYWVAASYVETGGQAADCPYGLPVTATVEVHIPTAEEAALREERREILIAEMTRCAKRNLTANISDDALPIINEYVENIIAGQVEEQDDIDGLSRLTVLACWDDSGDGSRLLALAVAVGVGFRVLSVPDHPPTPNHDQDILPCGAPMIAPAAERGEEEPDGDERGRSCPAWSAATAQPPRRFLRRSH